MTAELASYYGSETVRELVRAVDSAHLARALGASQSVAPSAETIDALRVAALLALADDIGDSRIDALLNRLADDRTSGGDGESLGTSFSNWDAFLTAAADSNVMPALEDLVLFAASGLIERRPTEVRAVLRRPQMRNGFRESAGRVDTLPWDQRVRHQISLALLLLVRQDSHQDIATAFEAIDSLAEAQKQFESEWLAAQRSERRDALTLLGLYHLAQAVIRISEFLLSGSVRGDGEIVVTDFAPELRRLMVRAEEYIGVAGDQETQFWVNGIAVVLWRLRTDSIWVEGKGISDRLDQLIDELARVGREQPVFSLLPSQQDALRKSLLDPARIAVVLQMPTSAGKTLLAEFAIVQSFEAYKGDARVVYVVPTRALATQVRRTLSEDLRPLGIQVAAAGSAFEEDPYELNLLLAGDGVVVATPEKLDLLLRAHPDWFSTLRLVVVDEAHLLDDGERGVRLELLLANLRRERPQCRLLLLTPFISNAAQIAAWLGGPRGLPIEVRWRPSRLLLGLARLSGSRGDLRCDIAFQEPHRHGRPGNVSFRMPVRRADVASTSKRVIALSDHFMRLGSVLALYSAGPKDAEVAASAVAERRPEIPSAERPAALRVAIAIARSEYGDDSVLARCLERGTAFHHSALSSTLRYLVEDQVRAKSVRFIAATTTLAQGMNFPVSAVLVHSVHKPYGGGDLSPSEFWNIAGRAGRVGLADRGLIVFASERHQGKLEYYARALSQTVSSALLDHLGDIGRAQSLKQAYERHHELRPFLQYLAHAAATMTSSRALASLEELLQGSLANAQAPDADASRALRAVARRYLEEIREKTLGYLKVSDSTGLGSFSFDELYAKIRADAVLLAGPGELLDRKQEGLTHLVEALKWLPELDLAIGLGEGQMSAAKVGKVVQGWLDGASIPALSAEFPGEEYADRVRNAAKYLHSKVSQVIAWGAHAYTRGWSMQGDEALEVRPQDAMLGAYIQFGVSTPEAAVASLLGVPRQFAEAFGAEYRERRGAITPERASEFKEFVEVADANDWRKVAARTPLAGAVDPADLRAVVRQMQGLI